MTQLVWNATGEREFQTGVDRGVLFATGRPGVAWNGLVKLTETPVGGTANPRYYDGMKIANPGLLEEFAGTLEAFMYPVEFEECDGTLTNGHGLLVSHQPRKSFDLSYRTKIGNDLQGVDYGYKIHFLYNLMAGPTTVDNVTIGAQVDPDNFSWALSAIPVVIPGYRPTAHFVIDSTKISKQLMRYIEDILYGTATVEPRMPTPTELDTITKRMVFREVVQFKNGWNPLIDSETPDLMGYLDAGKYSITPESRIVPAGKPGFYVLEK